MRTRQVAFCGCQGGERPVRLVVIADTLKLLGWEVRPVAMSALEMIDVSLVRTDQ